MKKLVFISILILFACDNKVDNDGDHVSARGISIYQINGANDSTSITSYFEAASPKSIQINENDTSKLLRIYFFNESRQEFQPASNDYTLRITFGNNQLIDKIIMAESGPQRWDFKLIGKKTGNTDIKYRILHLNHDDFKSKSIPVEIK